jgi:16S rRNA (guanine1207-N2)-methyltransferase
MLQSLLCDTVQFTRNDHILVLNSAADSFIQHVGAQFIAPAAVPTKGQITLAEDNVAALQSALAAFKQRPGESEARIEHIPFHEYTLHNPAATMDVAVMNMLYQPGNAWILYGLQVAGYALKPGGRLYVEGAKDRGVLTLAKRMQECFGNVETPEISKGHRVLCSHKLQSWHPVTPDSLLPVFAQQKLDEGTRLLLEALEVHRTDEALDIGCGAGFLGLHIARLAQKGHVTMVDASLAAVAAARQAVEQSDLTNVQVLPSDGTQAVREQRYSLIVTNPPFHLGGIQTTEVAERFIREAAQVLQPRGRFYLVANRFLKYEPSLRACFKIVEEVDGNTRYKVIRAMR